MKIRKGEMRSLLIRDGRSLPVQSSYCLVFGVRGDRSFILGDRVAFRRHSVIRRKKERSL
ncbi:hypothetical protein [Limnofasciculus baicalensis]|uniref:Uncharacterized protein n=1 Tax=Limnofasciculus baicalensis BBK-W-15 TaxID=2699891 RepID=A0AAE3GM16_9CYAN|nr:hypothetical protein [Limnofasciculus baicalensis]MCP2727091.1 hypothetical protein [Limnofasciculus baicalensis BBK-W-15]